MKTKSFEEHWNRQWPGLLPVAEDIRFHAKHWVRFHMLPDSKRYPETDEERRIIVFRHEQLLAALGGEGPLYTVTASWTNPPEPPFAHSGYESTYWQTIQHGSDEPRHLYVGESTWPSAAITALLLRVASDTLGGVIIAPPRCEWLYLPYDGGVDIIASDESQFNYLIKKFSYWLAPEWHDAKRYENNVHNYDQLRNKAFPIITTAYMDGETVLNLADSRATYWDTLDAIADDRTHAFKQAYSFAKSEKPIDRFYGYSLLASLFNPTDDEAADDARKMIAFLVAQLPGERDVSCLMAMAWALGFPDMREAEPALLELSASINNDVRLTATQSLGSASSDTPSDAWIGRMIALSLDEDDDIRDWATFNLANIDQYDSRIIEALVHNLDDQYIMVRTEAIQGLANKADTRALPALKNILKDGPVSQADIESAGIFGLPELLPLLEPWSSPDYLIKWARKRCSPDTAIKDSVEDSWANDKTYISFMKRRNI